MYVQCFGKRRGVGGGGASFDGRVRKEKCEITRLNGVKMADVKKGN